jgi:diguanylate cyclase (GGDEF)-like protein
LRQQFLDRVGFEARVGQALSRLKRHSKAKFAVLFIDLDEFKLFNESLGHSTGDGIIAEAGRRFAASLRAEDTLAHFGGDRFAVLLDTPREITDAIHAVLRMQESLRAPITAAGSEIYCSACVGIAWGAQGYEEQQQLIYNAEAAMNRAKSRGRGSYAVFDINMHEQARRLLRIETDLHRAIEKKEFCLHYQPIVAVDTLRITGLEALVRWNHPERGLMYPRDFLFAAERTGLIIPINQWVVRTAWGQVAEWQRQFPQLPPLTVSCNAGAKYLARPELAQEMLALASDGGLNPERVALEVTEEHFIDDPKAVSEILTRLRELGVQIYLDDFGTGYSSLNYLIRMPFDTLKIDRCFVEATGNDERQSVLLEEIVVMAHRLGLAVVAEGIETEEQLQSIKQAGCPMAQGFYFSKPLETQTVQWFLKRLIDW